MDQTDYDPPPGGTDSANRKSRDRSRSNSRPRNKKLALHEKIRIKAKQNALLESSSSQEEESLHSIVDQCRSMNPTKIKTKASVKEINLKLRKQNSEDEEDSEMLSSPVEVHQASQIKTNTGNNSQDNSNKDNLRYDQHDKGPFWVIIQRTEDGRDNNNHISDIGMGRFLKKMGCRNITNIKRQNVNSVKVYFGDFKSANYLMDYNLTDHKLTAYIPKSHIRKQGIIKGIPTDIADEELLEVIKSPIKVTEAFRFTRKGEGEIRTPTTVVRLSFKGSSIPTEISVYGAIRRVEYYTPRPRQCIKCMRWGHLDTQCKSPNTICENCSQANCDKNNCINTPFCINCKQQHKPTDELCTAKEKEKDILKLMAIKSINRREANQTLNSNQSYMMGKNNFGSLIEETVDSAFPPLTKKDETRNPDKEINKILLNKKTKTYAKVVKVLPNNEINKYYNSIRQEQDQTRGVALQNNHIINEYEKTISWIKSKLTANKTDSTAEDKTILNEINNKLKTLEAQLDFLEINKHKLRNNIDQQDQNK